MAGGRIRDDGPPTRAGRRRHYSDDEERTRIFDAAYGLLRDGTPAEASLSRILDEAGLSTRSFYRHFSSKDALLCAMYRRDARWAGRRITTAMHGAPSPVDAVGVWITEIFRIVDDPRRAERVGVLGKLLGSGADGMDVEAASAVQTLTEPLRESIEAGLASGVFDVASPARAADLFAGMVMHAAGLDRTADATERHDETEVARYVLRALGATAAG